MKILIELIERTVKGLYAPQSFTAQVLEVDREKDTCRVLPDDGAELYNVRLTAVEDSYQNKVVIYPVVGSYVMVSLIENLPTMAYVSKVGEIDEVRINSPKLLINNGDLGGMVKAGELREQYNKTKAIIDTLLQVCQTPINEPGNGSPSAFQAALNAAFAGKTTGDLSNIENEKVKH